MIFYDYVIKLANGEEFSLINLKGFIVLVVNVASLCGYTDSNYKELKVLLERNYSAGLRVVLFPCNQFLSQEPESSGCILKKIKEIQENFIVSEKVDVNGSEESKVYSYLKNEAKGIFGTTSIKWNFTKFLIDRAGNVVSRHSPSEAPLSLEPAIKRLMATKANKTTSD